MPAPFVVDQLIDQAMRSTGYTSFDSTSFIEGLEVLVGDVNRQNLSEPMRSGFEQAAIATLSNRLRVSAYLKGRPDLLNRPIQRPIFVFGVPRTGTTLLSNLLACDPGRRSPLQWEIEEPVPPATTETLYTDPRAIARLEEEKRRLAAYPESGKYYRSSAIYPNECIFFMQSDFKALVWESRGRLPEYRDWIFQTDMTSAYSYHKRFLQVLQADAPGIWNLKMPSHGLWLETLLATYPDARLMWTHRDPLTAVGSFCSIIALGHKVATGQVDTQWIAENIPWQAAEHANRIMKARDSLGADRLIDVHYADLVRNPIGTVRHLYKSLGDEFSPAAETTMTEWLDNNPQGKFGRHEYKLTEYGLSADGIRSLFEDYLSKYDVELEGIG